MRVPPFVRDLQGRHDGVEPLGDERIDHAIPVLQHEGAGRVHGVAKGPGEVDLESLRLVAGIDVVERGIAALGRDPDDAPLLGQRRRREPDREENRQGSPKNHRSIALHILWRPFQSETPSRPWMAVAVMVMSATSLRSPLRSAWTSACATVRTRPALTTRAAGDQALARGWRHEVDLELRRQDAGPGGHEGQRRVASRRIGHGRDRPCVDEAVLLADAGRDGEFDVHLARRDARQRRPDRRHHRLLGEARPNAVGVSRILGSEPGHPAACRRRSPARATCATAARRVSRPAPGFVASVAR